MKNKTEHTPGPIRQIANCFLRGMEYDTAEARAGALGDIGGYLREAHKKAKDNFSVYDAAPDLLAAAKDVVEAIEKKSDTLMIIASGSLAKAIQKAEQ